MVNLWFTDKDIRYRWAEVKHVFWEEFERQLRVAGKGLLEASLKAEQEAFLGAGHYERNARRRDYRNGYQARQVVWKLGVLSGVLVPRSRYGTYQSEIIQRYRRFGGGFDRHVLQLFTLGLATRRVERFFTEFFGSYGIGSQTVSDILKHVSADLQAYRRRQLSDEVRYLYLDGLYVTIRGAFRRKYVVLVAMAEYADGCREMVDFQVATSEKAVHWQAFLDNLYRRGLRGKHLQMVITDGAAGLIDAVRTVFGFVPIQICWVHRQRTLSTRLQKRSHRQAIAADAAAIFQAASIDHARDQARHFYRTWHPKEPRAVMAFLKDLELSLTFYHQPPATWSRVATNNILERYLRELRRRTRLIDSFRDEKSCERILYTQITELNRRLRPNPQPQFTQ